MKHTAILQYITAVITDAQPKVQYSALPPRRTTVQCNHIALQSARFDVSLRRSVVICVQYC